MKLDAFDRKILAALQRKRAAEQCRAGGRNRLVGLTVSTPGADA